MPPPVEPANTPPADRRRVAAFWLELAAVPLSLAAEQLDGLPEGRNMDRLVEAVRERIDRLTAEPDHIVAAEPDETLPAAMEAATDIF